MKGESKQHIAKIKNEYDLAVHACNLKVILGDKRDVIDHNIETLEAEIRNETLKLHRDEANGKTTNGLGEKIARNTELLNTVKETRRQLDEKLDEYEAFSEEMLRGLQVELIETILKAHPQEEKRYKELEKTLENESLILDSAENLEAILTEIEKLFEVIDIERRRVKSKWILGYLFGRNPNFAITSSLKGIAELASEAESTLLMLADADIARDDIFELKGETATYLEKLKSFSTLRWGWKKIDKDILPQKSPLKDLISRWKDMAEAANSSAEKAAQDLDAWVERNT